MPQTSNHKSRRKTPWDNSMERTASQQFLYDAYGEMYQQRHPVLLETGENALINSYVPEVCPHCQSEHIKRFGQTGNHIQRYRCLDCKKTFTPVTGTIFEGHKISIREWMDYTLNIFRYVSINADSWNNRNAFTTSRYWLEKIFLVLRAYFAEIEPFSGRVYLDETYYSVRSEDIKRTPEGAKLRGISTNQLCIGVACTDDRILCVFEGNGRPSKRKTFKSFKEAIAPGSTLIHDKDNTHSILIEKLGLSSEAYDADKIKLLPDKDNPLRRVNEVHARLKNFLYAHNSFNRDSLQDYLDLFSFAMNPPSDPLEKVDLLLNLSFKTSKTLRYRDFFSWKPRGLRQHCASKDLCDNRTALNGMLWIARGGAPWRELPERYGPWQTVYSRFRKWRDMGVFEAIFQTLSTDADFENISIDSTSCKVHQSANGGEKI